MNRATLCLFVLVVALTGCASTDPIVQWQRQVERYIDEEGGGNPAVLRRLGSDPVRRQIGTFGERRGVIGPTRTDVNSVVVGYRRIGDAYWLLMVMARIEQEGGVVDVQFDRPRVVDMRGVALSRTDDGYRWVISEEDPAQLEKYLIKQITIWSTSHPDRENQPIAWTRFPTDRDRFRAVVNGRQVTLIEEDSGASWTLEIPQD